jgi:serine/threonine protein phosphatase 1
MSKRIIAIGDIHGCYRALVKLMDLVSPDADDTLITLGDYTGRGDESRRVLERLVQLQQECNLVPILGNHDEMMLDAKKGPVEKSRWLDCGGFETMMSYGPDTNLSVIPVAHWRFLESCVPFFEMETHFFVHANYEHHLPLTDQSALTLRWLSLDDAFPRPHFSGKCAVVGHTPQMHGAVLEHEYLKAIDTGCGFGGRLTALEMASGRIWQVTEDGRVLVD